MQDTATNNDLVADENQFQRLVGAVLVSSA
jgi:hypothetical protein